METILRFFATAFRHLVLRPFDYILFGGSGVLWIPREEWRKMIHEDLQAGRLNVGSACIPDSAPVVHDHYLPDQEIPNLRLPNLFDDENGEETFLWMVEP